MKPGPQQVVIVKKRCAHGPHHGGAWKVAYADFVTALMAFFLVMWLVGQSKEVRAAVGGYFRDPGVFETQHGKGVLPGGKGVEDTSAATPPPQAPPADEAAEQKRLEEAVSHIREQLDQVPAFKTLRNQVEFTVTPEGLRIDLIERDGSSFFASGSAMLRPETERILGVIAQELGALNHQIVIEGHTDSRPYTTTDHYSNWELSADRANAARRVMEGHGLRAAQVSGVRGLADRQLRVPGDPLDARNRRVTILVQNPLFGPPPARTPGITPEPQPRAIMGRRAG